jgi:hypothetical protein
MIWLVAGLVVGLGYPLTKVLEITWNLAHGINGESGIFFTVYYYLTFTHLVHATWGILGEGPARAHYLIETLIATARQEGVNIPYSATTEYINTIPAEQQPPYPGDPDMEIKIHSYIRWNAMAMVVRANKDTNVGGHIASFASAAALYDVGFSHFWHAPPSRTTAT